MPKIDRGIEAIIRKAMEEGAFEELKGKGKPLNLGENPLVEPEWRMAYSLLQNEGFVLPWMEKRNEIEEKLKTAREELKRAWMWRLEKIKSDQNSALIESEWGKAQLGFREIVEDLNKHIDDYNLEVPSTTFQRAKVDVENEITQLGN